jgi:hypothetical protein
MNNTSLTGVSPRWRTAGVLLGAALLASWAYFAYVALDTGVSLTDCRAEQEHLQNDVQFLVSAASGHVTARDVLAARARQEPALPQRMENGNTLLLRTVTLQFGEDSLLKGVVAR